MIVTCMTKIPEWSVKNATMAAGDMVFFSAPKVRSPSAPRGSVAMRTIVQKAMMAVSIQ